jgi:hypothetical protein
VHGEPVADAECLEVEVQPADSACGNGGVLRKEVRGKCWSVVASVSSYRVSLTIQSRDAPDARLGPNCQTVHSEV